MPELDRRRIPLEHVRSQQVQQPLFEFSGACAGCGETPYLKLLTQLFGDRLLVANATGCSSIYGGNLPTTPWAHNGEGRGPAWSNSLFEDNAEFGLGFRVSLDAQREFASELLHGLSGELGDGLADAIRTADQRDEAGIHEQRERVTELKRRSAGSTARSRGGSARSPMRSCARVYGSSAAMAGPTTSASAASTTSWPAGAM
ncbi:MAG: hypothetical protein WDN28_01095 [Chthoniobacter sp.]